MRAFATVISAAGFVPSRIRTLAMIADWMLLPIGQLL
jgi:hypothetical protein